MNHISGINALFMSKIHLIYILLKHYRIPNPTPKDFFLSGFNKQIVEGNNMTTQTTIKSDTNPDVVNGIHLPTLKETVTAISQKPVLGKCKFRAENQWLEGNHNRSTIKGFYGAEQEIAHRQTFELDADEPPILAGHDQGANPVEHLLNALASCVTTSMVAHAAVRGIHIQELESELEGDIDLNGFLGLSETVPKGFTDIRIKFTVKTDEENLERLRNLAAYSPVFNTITQGANVDIQLNSK